jgi:cell division protein FtsI (penicillin-binding protein 3)
MSSNVGTSKIAEKLGKEALWKSYKKMDFGQKTNIEFPGEAAGVVRHYTKLSNAGLATMSYGNGISVTLLQIARAYTVFANNGVLMPVTLKKRQKLPVGTQVYSAKTANAVKAMLETVVQEGGTAPQAQVAGYSVAGKTGTSRKTGKHGYEKGKYISSFVGLAPAKNPRLIMAVMIDEPSIEGNRYYGGWVAGPVFSAVMSEALDSLSVPKDMPTHNVVMEQEFKEGQAENGQAH